MVALEDISGDKRPRAESNASYLNSPESKRVCVNPGRHEDDASDSGLIDLVIDEFPDELLEILSESDRDPAIHDLNSVIRSLQDEIFQSPNIDESLPDLGYLLEASDDELGLPPQATSPSAPPPEEAVVVGGESEDDLPLNYSDGGVFGDMLGFEHEFSSYDSLGFGLGEEETGSGDFGALTGLFDYNGGCEPYDPSGSVWQPECLPAV